MPLKKKNKVKRTPYPTRPKTRGECKDVPRPCPYCSCKYNTFLDVTPNGKLKIIYPEFENPSEMPGSNCTLDIVEKYGSMTLEDIGKILNITRERCRQIGDAAFRKLRP